MQAEPGNRKMPTPQFSLRTMLAIITFAAVTLALVQWLGSVGLVFGFLALIFAVGVWNGTDAFSVAVAVVVVGLLAMVLLPGWYGRGNRGDRVRRCPNNLKQIAMALDNYHDAYGCFPPAYSVDQQGRPMHSWRILILPYLAGPSAYQGYDFDEPWDGPNNRQLAQKVPDVFRCPKASKHGATGDTHYVAVVGNETLWRFSQPSSREEMLDGSSNTIAVVEAVDSGINWLEPRDLDLITASLAINDQSGFSLSSVHPEGCLVVMVDGSVQILPETTKKETLRALLTTSGGEAIPDF